MNSILIIIVGIIYLIVGLQYFVQGNLGMGLVFCSYSVANYGLYLVGHI